MPSRWIALAMVCAVAASAGVSAGPTPRPNFVVLLADDLGYGDVQAFANTTIRTPNLDRTRCRGHATDLFLWGAYLHSVSRRIADGALPGA